MERDLPEIHSHSDFILLFKNKGINNRSVGASGPDFWLKDYDCIGEIKKTDSNTDYNLAIKELFDRKNKYEVSKFNAIFVIMKSYIHVFPNRAGWYDLNSPINFGINELEAFIDFIKNNFNKVDVENHLEYVLDLLLEETLDLSVPDILSIILNLDKPYEISNKLIILSPLTENETIINTKHREHTLLIKEKLLDKFTIKNKVKVKDYIKYNYSSHLHDTKKSNLGKYYTPEDLVLSLKEVVQEYIKEDTYVLDLACGCGAFLELFNDVKIIGRDVDESAVEILDIFGFDNIGLDNSLLNINREKYNLSKDDDVVIIGNPPYNDVTSKNKRYGTNKKSAMDFEIDPEIKSNDLGRSFLRAYAKLNPNYICVLHPASYLIKKSNFNSLKEFNQKYKLIRSILFSSNEFKDMKNNTPFPISISLYEKGSMDFDYIRDFEFEIYNTTKTFKLSDLETIDNDDYIRKYPTKVDSKIVPSDINLYMYNIRDVNSLMASGNIKDNVPVTNTNYITVNFNVLYKYAYLNCMKLFLKNNFLVGNLSPIVKKDELENDQYLQDLFVMGMILKNSRRISIFDIKDKKNSIIYNRFLKNSYIDRSNKFTPNKKWVINIYDIFVRFLSGEAKEEEINQIYSLITAYFDNLLKNNNLYV